MQSRWEHFSHEADMGIRGIGETKEAAFEQAAMALTAVMIPPENVAVKQKVSIECEAPDDELLLVDWLNALIYETATHELLFSRYQVRISDHHLEGEAWGEPINLDKHALGVEVKGATYTALAVRQQPDGPWTAQCVIDV